MGRRPVNTDAHVGKTLFGVFLKMLKQCRPFQSLAPGDCNVSDCNVSEHGNRSLTSNYNNNNISLSPLPSPYGCVCVPGTGTSNSFKIPCWQRAPLQNIQAERVLQTPVAGGARCTNSAPEEEEEQSK